MLVDLSVLTAAENSFRTIEIRYKRRQTSFTRYSDVGAFTVAEQSNLALIERAQITLCNL